ncbi:MAG TPA: [LysW]-lysine hydrolase [Ktedonobacteraceae bacterium]|jgi:LysW-gamma-L-lysine carboxypeptidase
MNREIALSLLRRMVEIPSPSGQEGELATYLVESMQRLGLQSFIDEAGNAVGVREEGTGPLLLLLGHMDTVPGQLAVEQKGQLLYGRGVVDAKGALATFICAVAAQQQISGRLVVVGAVEEEVPSSRGAHFLLDRYAPDAVLIGEPGGWSNVVLGYKGKLSLSCTITRPQAHSAAPDPTASEAGVALWNRLVAYLATASRPQSVFYSPTPRLHRFEGSDRQASMQISCRLPPDFDRQAFEHHLGQIGQGEGIQLSDLIPAVLMPRNTLPARLLTQAIRQHGGQPKFKLKTGTSDMNVVSQRWQVPMVAYGPGDSHLDHTDHEHLDLDEYLRAIDVLTDALARLQQELPAAQPTYAPEEEQELFARLQALGYLE